MYLASSADWLVADWWFSAGHCWGDAVVCWGCWGGYFILAAGISVRRLPQNREKKEASGLARCGALLTSTGPATARGGLGVASGYGRLRERLRERTLEAECCGACMAADRTAV